MPSSPFLDSGGGLDTDRLLAEAVPLAELVALVAVLAAVPLLPVLLLGGGAVATAMTVLAQFVLAVGTGVVLIHVVVRGVRLAEGG